MDTPAALSAFPPRHLAVWRPILITALALTLAACPGPRLDPGLKTDVQEDRFDVVHTALLEEGRAVEYSAVQLPRDAIQVVPFDTVKREDPPVVREPEKIHPLLERHLESRSPDERERIVVSFREDITIPRFPEPAVDEPRDSPANQRALAAAERMIDDLARRRAAGLDQRLDLLRELEGEVLETFWLVNAVLVELPLRAVERLADIEDVVYLEPERTEDAPPQNANNSDDVDDGRARIVSDPYFNLGLTSGFIGLLDTGIRRGHILFNSPSHIDFVRDCVNGGANCNTGTNLNPADDCWNHGTSSAAIISGNGRAGNPFRGVTAVTLDSWKVYPTSFTATGACNGFLNTTAVIRGFERAVAVLDRVIVAEMQGSGDYLSAISAAADAAFDAGAVIIAANGNNGPAGGTVNSPANAHRVIGVGNFDVQTQNPINSQSRGPTSDNRIKPDIQAPTNTETASAAGDSAFRVFGGTSGATPYVSGAAALVRNWLRRTSSGIDPGQVYAFLILSGQRTAFDNTRGAGPMRLPTDGWAWWGKVSVGHRATIEIPIQVQGANPNTLDVAIWWPESGFRFLGVTIESHNDIDVHLVDPSGVVRASSISIPSVFERARVSGAVSAGTWRVRIRGFSVPSAPQTVYYAAHVRVR